MAEKAFITSAILKWARESANIAVEEAAKRVKTSPQRILSWENEEDYPTLVQAKKLANYYRRPFSIFFLPNVPQDYLPLQDFRRDGSRQIDTASIFMIREIQEKQQWLSDFLEDNEESPLSFIGKYTISSDPQIVAKDILDTLNIDPLHYKDPPLKEWLFKSERRGIYISRASHFHSRMVFERDLVQGFAIADSYAPFVFINTKNYDAPQLFTLLHELAHLWIAKSGISNDIDLDFDQPKQADINPVEIFCNQVAANALMPDQLMVQIGKNIYDSYIEVYRQARNIGVSSIAFLYRAYSMNIISESVYQEYKEQARIQYEAYLEKERMRKEEAKRKDISGPPQYLLRVNKNGRSFTRIVLDAYNSGTVAPTVASSLLRTQINKFSEFEKYLAHV